MALILYNRSWGFIIYGNDALPEINSAFNINVNVCTIMALNEAEIDDAQIMYAALNSVIT